MKKTEPFKMSALSGVLLAMLTGCAPSESVPPLFGPESERIIVYILIVLVAYLIWNVSMNKSDRGEKDAENDLEHLNSRLYTIEKDIQKIKSAMKGKDHDER